MASPDELGVLDQAMITTLRPQQLANLAGFW
jgi:hypothetical protein